MSTQAQEGTMSTERDELANLLADSIFRYTGVTTSSSKSMADELIEAGYRKPQPPTITEDALTSLVSAALRMSADEVEGTITAGDVAEVAAPVPGEQGRAAAVEARDEVYNDPAGWLRDRADAIERGGAL